MTTGYKVPSHLNAALEGFHAFWSSYPERKYDSLEDVILRWLKEGDGVADCYGEYQIFLGTVALLFASYHDDLLVDGEKYDDVPTVRRMLADTTSRLAAGINIFNPVDFVFAREAYHRRIFQLQRNH